MESDDEVMEMTQEELRQWIKKEVNSQMVDLVTDEQRCRLLEKNEKRKAGLLKLTQSVADYEVVVRQLYRLLGWEYKEEDSEAEDELQHNPPAVGKKAVEEASTADADGHPIDCGEKPKLKHKLDATSTCLETDGFSPQSKCTRTVPDGAKQCIKLRSGRPVVVLKRLPVHEIRSALRRPSPKPHDIIHIGGCSDDDHDAAADDAATDDAAADAAADDAAADDAAADDAADDADDDDNAVGDEGNDIYDVDDDDTDDNDDDVIDKDWVTGSDSSSDDSWTEDTAQNGKAFVHRGKKSQKHSISNTSADNNTKKQSTPATNETINPDAPTSAKQQQSCGIVVSSFSQCSGSTEPPNLPEQKIGLNMKVLARRKGRKWLPGEIMEIISKEGGGFKYKVSLEEKGRILVSGHHLAFENTPSLGRLYVGARVVTKYWKDEEYYFYSGILGELPSRRNRMRFLVFFDDHTPTYVGLPFLRLVCRPLKDPWADITEDTHRRFVREYIKVWPYPTMAHYCVDQKLNVECEGVQRACEVLQIDCSLMQVLFKHSGHKEWIYRGSMRLEHLVTMKKILQKKDGAGEKRATTPSVASTAASTATPPDPSRGSDSTAGPPPAANQLVNYKPHVCSPACLEQVRPDAPVEAPHKCNPLLIPMMYKFRRVKKSSPDPATMSVPVETKQPYGIYYYAPCGLTLSTVAEVEEYLHVTRCDFVSMDAFSLDPRVSVAGVKHVPFKVFIPDLASGLENKTVPCINEHNNLRPSRLTYKSSRNTSAVGLDTRLDFVTGCDCVDGCRNSESCACRQLTIQSTETPGRPVDEKSGYTQKRLNRKVVTGVYECNAKCGCDPRTCSNRVAQHGIQVRLQVFMTQDRGWGVRCLDDIPGGTFVCSYSGKVVRGTKKNMISNAHYVKLNHIEAVVLHKEDYEAEAYHSDTETEHSSEQSKEQEENRGRSASKQTKAKDPSAKGKKPASSMDPTTSRCLFDGEDHCYIIDANLEGNVARFLNHSCSPNLFKQFVFVDTHDLRFPWLTFFTRKRVKARTELTWDYSSAKEDAEKLLGWPCRCGSKKCSVKL